MPRLALIQMEVEPEAKESNLLRAGRLIGQAAAEGAEIVLLPEAADLGWMHASCHQEAETVAESQAVATYRETSTRHGIHVCGGFTEREGDRVYNAAVLLSPSGELLLHHRKIHELEIAHDCYALGDRLGVCDTPLGRIGLMICADAFASEWAISRSLGMMGAEMILSPCAWAVPPDHDNGANPYGGRWTDCYCPVAKEFHMWIAGCSNVGSVRGGPWDGWNCIGCSLVVDQNGSTLAKGPYGLSASM